jgi:endonuclease/exonuclease/phosphatase family metal-dependent hydrolase
MVEKPRRVDGGAGSWASVTTGGYHTCAVGTDGSLWCWGQNTLGQLGNTQPGLHPTATRVGTDSDWVQASASWGHTCAVTATGRLWCWGLNDDGQLGVGDRRDWWRPQAVAPARIWTAVTTGDALTCALDDQGGSWCWGDDLYGQLDSAGGPSTVPQRADTQSTLTSIDAGWMHVCALAGATRTCWGSNEVGQLGTTPSGRRTTTGTTGSVLTEAQVARQHAVLARGARLLRLPPAEQVRREIGDRPAVPAAARAAARRSLATTVMTFNLLGSNHTAPTGDRPDWPPGRIRSEWAADLVAARSGSLVGIQEIQPDQVVSLAAATGNRFTIWPGNSMGYAGAPQSLMWRTSEWKAVWKSTVTIPFMRTQSRPQPVVRLRNVATGQEVYMLNAHLSPGKMEADRDRGTKLIIKTIKELQPDGLPILLTGDFNEHGEVFCKVVRQTQLVAALGGSSTAEGCSVPARARVDWIFGSKGSFGTVSVDQGTLVRRTTDHAIQDVTFAVQ